MARLARLAYFSLALALTSLLITTPPASAQGGGFEGTITDGTGAALPGVTVTAAHVATGNVFNTVSDSQGAYRFAALRPGVYSITAELAGFKTVVREGLELLVGQYSVLDLAMELSTVEESVTVTGAAPLVDVTRSQLGGNIDPRQMQEVPVNGRNWLELAALAPGARGNATGNAPMPRDNGAFQLNLDGQQVTSIISARSFGQPQFSRDAIGEFQFITNRFDATQGRSMGAQVNAVTKSGTNSFAGSAFGFFRDDRFNAPDFIVDRVLPYSNQQAGATLGGPVIRDRVHFFAAYEYEREPNSVTFTSPYPTFNVSDLSAVNRQNKYTVRVDTQFTPSTRLTVRGTKWDQLRPNVGTGGATRHPSTASFNEQSSAQGFVSLTQVISARTVNEAKGGYVSFDLASECYQPSLSISLRGYAIGCPANFPQTGGQGTWSVRDDLTHYADGWGRHELKAGGELLRTNIDFFWALNSYGALQADAGPVPANIEQLFPVWNDISTWNLAALSPISVRWRQAFGDFNISVPITTFGVWLQDNWRLTDSLTLNLGLRYDIEKGSLAEDSTVPPFLSPRAADKNNLAPRVGFAYALADQKTVIRGGVGRFFAQITNNQSLVTKVTEQTAVAGIDNTGAPDFAANPWGGTPPSLEQARLTTQDLRLIDPTAVTPYAYQASIGVQRQVGEYQSVQADYVYTGSRDDFYLTNINMTQNPATGFNYPFTDVSRRPHPDYGTIAMYHTGGRSNYHGLQTAWTKRFTNRWQASATYTLSQIRDTGTPYASTPDNSFDIDAEYAPAVGDQRHRVVFNGIVALPWSFQLSGLYFFGSGEHFNNTYGGDLRNTGGWSAGRLRPDGSVVPRNSFVGEAIHRIDARISRRFNVVGTATIEGLIEAFNLLNHRNYGSYVLSESNASFGRPQQSSALAYQARMLQFGIRLNF